MRRLAVGLVIGSLVLGGMALPAAEAGGKHRGYYGHRGGHYGHGGKDYRYGGGYFAGGFLAGAGTVLVLNALLTPRVVYAPPVAYAAPVVYQPVYRTPICQDVWVQERWEVRPQQQNGFTTYYQVLVPGYWQRQCY
jgi:hypothetical protein